MTMDTLRKAMREFLDVHAEYLIEMYEDEYPDITEDEVVEKVLEDVATEAVLEYINDNLKILPVVELEVEGDDVTSGVVDMEIDVGHNINHIEKLFNKPVCLIGECVNGGGGNGLYSCMDVQYTFLTVDGEWKSVDANIIQESYANSDELYFCMSVYKESDDTYYGLERLRDLIPDDYDGELYNYI